MTRRGFDRGALVLGVVFTVIGATFLLQEAGMWNVRAGVFLPALLVLAGGLMVLTAMLRPGGER